MSDAKGMAMLRAIETWLAGAGFGAGADITPMAPGLGHTAMWRIAGGRDAGDLVLRLFPAGHERSRDRETLAMRAVREAGLPVPEVLVTGAIDDRPAMLVTLVPGETVRATLGPDTDQATETGRLLGTLLGEINRLPAPGRLAPAGAWLERPGPALAPLRDRLALLPNADRLLHLDYHPENVLMDGGAVTGVIDWTNTLPGPPRVDLGRSRAILRMARTLARTTPEAASAVEALEAGLVEGHAAIHGPDPEPDLSLAWGLGTVCTDFASHVAKPDTWVTPELVARLNLERDRLVARVIGGTAR